MTTDNNGDAIFLAVLFGCAGGSFFGVLGMVFGAVIGYLIGEGKKN